MRTTSDKPGQGGQCGQNPVIVDDAVTGERHVEVATHQDPPT
jgi:hypothetical protein